MSTALSVVLVVGDGDGLMSLSKRKGVVLMVRPREDENVGGK